MNASASSPAGSRALAHRDSWLVAGAAALLFAVTAQRDLAAGDAGELLLAARTFGIPHPPGYPLWVWLAGALGAVLPGPFAFRVALLSVISAAAGLGFLHVLARRSGVSRPAAAAAVLGLAVTPCLWQSAGSVEVYALAFAVDAAAAWAVCGYATHGGPRRLFVAALATALACTCHQSAVVFLPLALLAVWPRLRCEGSRWKPLAGGVALGLAPFLWLPIRSAQHPVLDWGADSGGAHWVANLTRACYGPLAQNPLDGSRLFREALYFILYQVGEWGPGIALVAIVGWALWLRRSRRVATLALGALLALPVGLALILRFEPDPTHAYQVGQFLMPMTAVMALAVAHALDQAFRTRLRLPAMALAALWVAGGGVLHYADADQHDLHLARRFGQDLLRPLPAGSTLFVEGDNETFTLAYLQKVEGLRPDVRVIHRKGYVFEDIYHLRDLPRSQWARRQGQVETQFLAASTGPVYCSGNLTLPPGWGLAPQGLLSRVTRGGEPVGPDRVPSLPASLPRLRRTDYVTRKMAASYLEGEVRRAEHAGSVASVVRAYQCMAYVAYDFPEAHYDLSRALLLAGYASAARSEYRAALLLAPREAWLRDAGRKLGLLTDES